MRKRIFALVLGVIVLASMAVAVPAQDLLSSDLDLSGAVVIIHTNDSHGRIVSGGNQIGFYQVSGLRNLLEAAGAEVLLLDAGDTLHGLPVATIRQGMDIVEIMNAVGYDAFAPGNHDFNYGFDRLRELGQVMNFPILVANAVYNETGESAFQEHVILERAGMSFGIFGLITQDTSYRTNPINVEMLTFTDPLEAASRQVELLQEAGVDFIVALAHMGIDYSSGTTADMIAAQVDGIDIFVDGHSHVAIENSVPLRDDISLIPHGDTVLVSTSGHMAQVGVVVVNDGAITSTLLTVADEIPADEAVESMIADLIAAQDVILSEVVGYTEVLLDGERENVRTVETNLGNLSTDAILAATGADLAITNGGGIRDSIPVGPITRGDLVTVFPFGNYVVTKEVSGASILEALEHSVSAYPAESGGFLQVSGISFTFDPSLEAGSRVTGAVIGGDDIDPASTYLLATNNFLSSGGDGYSMLVDYPVVGNYSALEEVLIEFIQNNPDLVANAATEGRITSAVGEAAAEEAVEEAAVEEATAEEAAADVVTEPLPVPVPVVEAEAEAEVEVVVAVTPAPAAVDGVYTVVAGDSLYRIARNLLGSGSRWGEIYELNDIVTDPRLIQIGWQLRIPA